MARLSAQTYLESLEHYQELVGDYKRMINENEEQLVKPDMNQFQREALEALNDVCKEEKKKCQKAIERLLSE